MSRLRRAIGRHKPLFWISVLLGCLMVGALSYPALAQSAAGSVGNSGLTLLDGSLGVILKGIVGGLLSIVALVFVGLGNLFLYIINSIILPGQNSLLFSSTLENAWQTILNIANLIFFLALFVFSIMIIVRYSGYGFKKAIVSLLTAVILANMSYRIVKILVEVGDSMRNLSASLLGVDQGQMQAWLSGFGTLMSFAGDPNASTTRYILTAILLTLMSAIFAFVFYRLMYILLERAVRLALLTIFAPAQIALGVLPQKELQGLSGNWFGEVVKWVLVLPLTFIILAVGQKLMPTDTPELLKQFLLTNVADSAGGGDDNVTGVGAVIYGIIAVGVMFAATKTPDMLKISLSGATKFLTDSADKSIVGGLQNQVTGTLRHNSRLLGSWATETFKPVKHYRGWLAKNRLNLDAAKEQVARVNKDEGNKQYMKQYRAKQLQQMRQLSKKKLASGKDSMFNFEGEEGDADYGKSYADLRAAHERAGGYASTSEEAKRLREKMTRMEKRATNNASKEIEKKSGPTWRKKYDKIIREIGHDEAAGTTRSNIDLLRGTQRKIQELKRTGQYDSSNMKDVAEEVVGSMERIFKVGTAAQKEEANGIMQEIFLEDPDAFMEYMGQTLPRDDQKGSNFIDELRSLHKATRQAGTLADGEEEEPADEHDRAIAGTDWDPALSPKTESKPHTPTEALGKVAALKASQQAIKEAADAQGISLEELMEAQSGKVEEAIDGLFDPRSGAANTAKDALGFQLQYLAQSGEVDPKGAQMAVDIALNEGSRQNFLSKIQELADGGVKLSQDNIQKAKALQQNDEYANPSTTDARRATLTKDALGTELSSGAVSALASGASDTHLQSIVAMAQARNQATGADAAAMDSALEKFSKIMTKNAYAESRDNIIAAQAQAGTVDHPQRASIEATAANVAPENIAQVTQIASEIRDALEELTAQHVDGNNGELKIASESIDNLAKTMGGNIKSSMSELGRLIGRPQEQPLLRLGGEDQKAGKVYTALTQLVNTLQRKSGGNQPIR